jgi:hypothetical protein
MGEQATIGVHTILPLLLQSYTTSYYFRVKFLWTDGVAFLTIHFCVCAEYNWSTITFSSAWLLGLTIMLCTPGIVGPYQIVYTGERRQLIGQNGRYSGRTGDCRHPQSQWND